MSERGLVFIGRSLTFAWVTLVGLLLAVFIGTNVAPMLGRSVFVVHGSSMAPAIPLGALLVDQPVDPAQIAVGDVITLRAPNGVVVTHRVSRVVSGGDSLRFETRGDANDSPDAVLTPADAVIGRAEFHVPLAGFVLALAATTSGLIAILAALGALIGASWLIEGMRSEPEVEPKPLAHKAGSQPT